MTVEELAKSKANSVPNSKLVKYYMAGVPQWHMESILTLLKQKEVTVLQEFILKFASAGISSISEISNFLGISIASINRAVADMQKDGLVLVDIFNMSVKLTERGIDALNNAATIVPEDLEYAIYMDGLTGKVFFDVARMYTQNELKKNGILPIRTAVEKPTLEELHYEEVKRALNLFKKRNKYGEDKLEGDLQEIASIKKTYVEYKKVSVLVFMNEQSGEIEFQVYEGANKNDEYGIAIQKQYNDNDKVVEFDVAPSDIDEENQDSLLNVLPKEIVDNASSYIEKTTSLDKELDSLTVQKKLIEESTVNSEDEDESATERIRLLEKRIVELEAAKKSADRPLFTYDHRPLLLKTLDTAQRLIVIVSPWIKYTGLDYEVMTKIEKAMQRNVRVIIGYGYSQKEDSDPAIIRKLHALEEKKNYGKNLCLKNFSNTHEKVLIKDNDYLVITSFNWLSFKGDPKKSFRQETGYYTESKDAIKKMKDNLSNRLGVQI